MTERLLLAHARGWWRLHLLLAAAARGCRQRTLALFARAIGVPRPVVAEAMALWDAVQRRQKEGTMRGG